MLYGIAHARNYSSRGSEDGSPALLDERPGLEMKSNPNGYLDIDHYDEIPYDDRPYNLTHIRHLETMAVLHGMEPAPVTCCRVLELGAASGGNLIPQAMDLPQAHFVGVDLSEGQIASARETIDSLGLSNITMRHADIRDVGAEWGTFDYIIAHGVFSWVEPEVRERLFAICSELLSPHGVAVLTYNTYPGWHFRRVARDLVGFHTQQFDDPMERLSQGRAILDFMAETTNKSRAYGRYYEEESDMLEQADAPGYFYHEYLETHNFPVYFTDFVKMAAASKMQYLCDANWRTSQLTNYPESVRAMLQNVPPVEREQYFDFMQNRTFRSTLLCHDRLRLHRNISPKIVRRMHISMPRATRMGGAPVDVAGPTRFFEPHAGTMTVSHVPSKRALAYLQQVAPGTVDFQTLCCEALCSSAFPSTPRREQDIDQIASTMLAAFSLGMVEFRVHPATEAVEVGDQPIASPLARYQANNGRWVTNLRHQALTLDDISLEIMRRMDGKHDRHELAGHLKRAIQEGRIDPGEDGHAIAEADDEGINRVVDYVVDGLSRLSVLID